MKQIRISDVTMKAKAVTLSFREKIELAKLLDSLGVSVIELEGIDSSRTDALRIKSVAAAVKESTVAVPVKLEEENIEAVWNALKLAKKPRLQVCAPISSVQMEYLYHKKAETMLEAVCNAVSVPVIASGGAGKMEDFTTLFQRLPKVDAGLAASIFHFGEVKIPELKDMLAAKGIEVRR